MQSVSACQRVRAAGGLPLTLALKCHPPYLFSLPDVPSQSSDVISLQWRVVWGGVGGLGRCFHAAAAQRLALVLVFLFGSDPASPRERECCWLLLSACRA